MVTANLQHIFALKSKVNKLEDELRQCPNPGGTQGQVGWGPGQPELVGGSPAHGRGWGWVGFRVLSKPFCDSDSNLLYQPLPLSKPSKRQQQQKEGQRLFLFTVTETLQPISFKN